LTFLSVFRASNALIRELIEARILYFQFPPHIITIQDRYLKQISQAVPDSVSFEETIEETRWFYYLTLFILNEG